MKKHPNNLMEWFPLVLILLVSIKGWTQASVSYPFAVGRTSCGSGTHQVHFYTYNNTTNTISSINSNTGVTGYYTPQLRVGSTTTGGWPSTSQRFTSGASSITYNPVDKNIYYLWTSSFSGQLRTYAWRWIIGTKPTGTSPRQDTLRSFAFDILGVAFDAQGNGYMLEFSASAPYVPILRSINFTTGAIGGQDTLELTGGATIYESGSGDVAMTPSGQMFFVVNNKLFSPDYKSYSGTGKKITCTYIDTVINSTTGNFVGLTYAGGETISAYSGSGCPFFETNPLTATTTNITKSGTTTYSASDLATVVSGIGVAKKLVSYTATGTPKQYDVVYEIIVKNYGNYDLTGVQVNDDLRLINTNANVTNGKVEVVSNPANLPINTAFDGKNSRTLFGAGATLPNYPVANNTVILKVSCRLSNIEPGIIYKNSATATATGFNTVSLTDISTNGSLPDLNNNDKADDAGEDQPTPFLIGVTSQTPPCAALSTVLFNEDFGTGGTIGSLPATPGVTTQYAGSTTQPLAIDRYMITNNVNNADNNRFISLTDHTGGTDGRMMVVNADASSNIIYSGTVNSFCAQQQYSLFFFAAFAGNPSYKTVCDAFGGFKYPKIKMRIKDPNTGLIITEMSTDDISSTSWNQYGMKWIMPGGYSSVIFELINDGQGGCGNDIAIDDIQLGLCDPVPTVTLANTSAGCIGSSTQFTATLNDAGVIPGSKDYQWQISTDGTTWTNISGAIAQTYSIPTLTNNDVNKHYRVIVAAQGNIGSSDCRYTSPAYLLTAKAISTAPTGISVSENNICPGEQVTLTVQGGSLGGGAIWRWYTSSCGGILVGTGASVNVNPVSNTIYYVRAEGDCNTTTCTQFTVVINCDIDKDKDGIPNTVEGTGDADGDGIANLLDLDSDNDGIPDVVESGGVDANGDGRIDNFTDTDNDGLSQNVDVNNTGHAASGSGLGLLDTDGDGVPNLSDLDSDNDGVPDVIEANGNDADINGRVDGYVDSDNDGFSDNVDGDVGNDGTAENAARALLRTGADTNNNGRADSYPYKNMDGDNYSNPYDLESDGDGINDVVEAGLTDTDHNGTVDGTVNVNGWNSVISSLGTLTLPNTDNNGNPDLYDIDADDDGITDNIEGQFTNTYSLPSYLDSDGDGIDNAYDDYNGFGGSGIFVVNTDGDPLPDYRDTDADADTAEDLIEGNDLNLNGRVDDNVKLTTLDTDGDGLDDFFDTDHTSANVTSRYMGNNGSFSGPALFGTRSVLQQTDPASGNRDWRSLSSVLDCRYIEFKARAINFITVKLNWTIICDQETSSFVVERKDVSDFKPVYTENTIPVFDRKLDYEILDDLAGVKSNDVYYRLKAINKDGRKNYSNIVKVNLASSPDNVLVLGNPVQKELRVLVETTSGCEGQFELLDGNGRLVKKLAQSIVGGKNLVKMDVGSLSSGAYYFNAVIDGKHHTRKVYILK